MERSDRQAALQSPLAPSAAAPAPGKKGFGGFLSQVKDAASRVVDDTSKNLNQASICMQALHRHLARPLQAYQLVPLTHTAARGEISNNSP